MIEVGDRVSFFVEDLNKWYSGLVIMVRNGTTYIYPDSKDEILFWLTQLNSGLALKKLSNTYIKINNIESYGGQYVYFLWNTCEGTNIKKLSSASSINNSHEDGCICASCKHFIQYAAPNQTNNTFICYSCVTNPVRAYY